jgi:hypothetical protein
MHWTEKHFGGHITFTFLYWRIVIYGFNAMHVAINIRTQRWGYICFHPPIKCFGKWWPWYFYLSPNATPWAATFAVGPGLYNTDRYLAKIYCELFGHNFDTDHYYDLMMVIKDTLDGVRGQIVYGKL